MIPHLVAHWVECVANVPGSDPQSRGGINLIYIDPPARKLQSGRKEEGLLALSRDQPGSNRSELFTGISMVVPAPQ